MRNKFGQEEMVGFALIIVLVSVIILIFLGFSLRDGQKEAVESYEVESFVLATLQYTTDCENLVERLSIQKLISSCSNEEECLDGRETCNVLSAALTEIIEESWNVGENSPINGYKMEIISEDKRGIISPIQDGETTKNYKGTSQEFSPLGGDYDILFKVYY